MATVETTNTSTAIEKGTLVELPRHLRGMRQSERIGVVQRLLDSEESPLAVESAVIQMMGGYRLTRKMGDPVVIALSELSRKRVHANCQTCTCGLPKPEGEKDQGTVDIDEDEDDEDELEEEVEQL